MAKKLKMPYKDLLPPLSTAEREALKSSIKADGVRDPIFVDENGNILDGHNRYEIDPKAPTRVVTGLTDAEKEAFVYQVNFHRRNLSPEVKAEKLKAMKAIASKLREEDANKNTQQRIAMLLGVSQGAVAQWFSGTIISANNSSAVDARVKVPPKAHPVIFDRVESGESTSQLAADFGVTDRQIRKIVEKQAKARELARVVEEKTKTIASVDISARAALHVSSVADLPEIIEPGTVDVIITDPPYPKEFLETYSDLAATAKAILKPGGFMLAMVGQSYLIEICNRLATHLKYNWTVSYLTPGGQSAQLWERKVNTFWKPVLWFVNGDLPETANWVGDVCNSPTNANDKRFHEWGQSVGGMAALIDRFTTPGQTICDPFCGGGTTGVAAVQMDRMFIGSDIDADHIATTERRIKEASLCTKK